MKLRLSLSDERGSDLNMTKTILCIIDMSGSSKETIRWAIIMSQQLNAHLTILYTYRLIPSQTGEMVQLKKKIEERALQKFKTLENELLLKKGISYEFRVEVGFVSDRIDDHAKKNQLNFLVLDKNINTNSKETLDNSLEHIQVPMLLIP